LLPGKRHTSFLYLQMARVSTILSVDSEGGNNS